MDVKTMCLAIPGKVLSIEGQKAQVDFDGIQKSVVIALLPRVTVGKYVIVHAGYAIQEVDEEEAMESLKTWRELVAIGEITKEDVL
jgi:hydrogenase expression/formation protein HypC